MGSYRFRRFFLSLLVVFVLFSVCSKSYATIDTVADLEQEMIELERQWQDDFIIVSLYPYMNNTDAWQNILKPIFDDIHDNDYSIYITLGNSTAGTIDTYYNIRTFSFNNASSQSTMTFNSQAYTGVSVTTNALVYDVKRNSVTFTPSTNSFTNSITYENNYKIARTLANYKSPMWYDFMQLIYSDYADYGDILNDIKDYVAHIDINTSVDRYGYILSQIYTVCSQISQNIGNYSQDLQDIQDKLDDINDELTAINTYLNNTTLDSNTITNNFPNNSGITSPTDSILSNIFTEYQNAFTSTNYTDIVIPLGFVNQTLTIPSNYTETYFPTALVTIIQLCYWYVISRWIILSLIKLVNSLRNLDFMEKTSEADPKTELL